VKGTDMTNTTIPGLSGAASQYASPSMNYYIPQWEERTSYGVRRIDPYAKLFEDRIIFLGTPISDDIANAVMAPLLCL
jgi:ATP-dependent Clp protease, protease subunit